MGSTVIFGKGQGKRCKVYRIPALFYEKERQFFLAFAEQRKKKADETAEKLVMKRGVLTDKRNMKSIQWTEVMPVEEAQMVGHRPMNPCPVYDEQNQKLFLFFICVEGCYTEAWQIKHYCNKARLCYIMSEDLGQTWSKVTDLTEHVSKSWVTFAVGPGHGLQTKNGRLIVPVYAYEGVKPETPVPHALALYSDDRGQRWRFGKMLETESLECEMAEVSNDGCSFIYCNARSRRGHRVEAISHNGGKTFGEVKGKLVETGGGCQGSVVSFPAQTKAEGSQSPNAWLLFSHPTCKSQRTHLGVYLNKSPQSLNAWSKPWVINKGYSGYSDLAYVDDGWFACLMECSKCIVLCLLHFSEIEHGVRHHHPCVLL